SPSMADHVTKAAALVDLRMKGPDVLTPAEGAVRAPPQLGMIDDRLTSRRAIAPSQAGGSGRDPRPSSPAVLRSASCSSSPHDTDGRETMGRLDLHFRTAFVAARW